MASDYDYDRTAGTADADLSAYAVRAFQLFRYEPARERSLAVARTVGRQAARIGWDQAALSSWLQATYGSIWVRQTNLNPGADLKEVRKELLAGFRLGTRKAGEGAAAFARGFFEREPGLARYAPARVVDKAGGNGRHPEAQQHGNEIWLYPKFWRLDPKTRDFVFAHEIGHFVLSETGLAKLIQSAPRFGVDPWDIGELPFGQTNMDEAFADAFATWHLSPAELRRCYPSWAGLVNDLS